MSIKQKELGDMGERDILNKMILPMFPFVAENFDDCATLPMPPQGCSMVITTDPCPTPVICMIESPDMYHYGRMTALISVSDLASMGATPMGMLVSTVMPENMAVEEYNRFLIGLSDACNEWKCPVIGGNIKDGQSFTANATAIGCVKTENIMKRKGATPKDKVCVIGEMGLFWSAVLKKIEGIKIRTQNDKLLNNALYKPTPKILEGIYLAETKSITSCMDSSDGIYACLREIAITNGVDIIIQNDWLTPHEAVFEVADSLKIDFRNLMFAWGDWELVCTVSEDKIEAIESLMKLHGAKLSVIGTVKEGSGKVFLEQNGELGTITDISSERFCKTSMFTYGIEPYIKLIKNTPFAVFK